LRDLVLLGHKPSSIRFLLASAHYRTQLNFTFEALKQAANSVERLRNFQLRLRMTKFPTGSNPKIAQLASEAAQTMRAGLEDDLNTPQAVAPIFEMVRQANVAADAGELRAGDVPSLLETLEKFDQIFSVLQDDDAPKMRRIVEWAKAEGKLDKASKEVVELAGTNGLPDEQIEQLVMEHEQARKARDFAKSDALRAQLSDAGVVVENTKEGVRWRRK